MNFSFLKKKKFYIPAIIIVIALIWYGQYQKSHQPTQYDTVAVVKGDIKQTVDATGNVESNNDLALRFEIPGTVAKIMVTEGQKVTSGTVLANLGMADLNAAVAQAAANLNQKLAGASTQDISYYQAAADSAQASLEQAKIDGQNSVNAAQSDVQTAENNLKLAEGGESSQIVTNVYKDAAAVSQASLSVLDNALTQSDNILGVDNTLANSDFKSNLAASDPGKLSTAQTNYLIAKSAIALAKSAASPLNTNSQHSDIDNALNLIEDALSKTNQLLGSVSDVLMATMSGGNLTQAALDTKKTTISTTRTAATTQLSTVITQIQSISDAKNSYSTYEIAYYKAYNDYSNAQASADNNIKMKQAAYDQALANLQTKKDPPREVDVAAYRAALSQAVANRNKAIIRAPIDGVITKVNNKIGELVTSADAVVEMLSPHYEVSVDIPETDIPKLKLNDSAEITLDAYGDDNKFTGVILSIEPGSTVIQDVVYYRVKIKLDDNGKTFRPGMTANVSINTDSRTGVLYIPLRAVHTDTVTGEKSVKLLDKGQVKETPVQIGLKADNGFVEIKSGLTEGQTVILNVKQ
ncbi:MAG: efflux RND transporter periplasmic adaptor subunit [Patescibacteria group bacterium]